MNLNVVTYNLKFPDPNSAPWDGVRRPLVRRQLTALAPDVVATQEGHYHQIRHLAEDLGSQWQYLGTGRDGGSTGEWCGILFDGARFEPVAFDHFWLSDTPEAVGSRTPSWGNHGNCRMATWARLRDRATAAEVLVLDTHLDESSERARVWGAELIAARLNRPGLPEAVVVCGDFNAPAPTSDAYRALTARAGLRDAWLEANSAEPKTGTFTGWDEPVPGGDRIDWILHRGPLTARRAVLGEIRGEDGQWPSDHLPVSVALEWDA
ncbi:hypothetical protein BIV57_16315 [Mangrovactinospora gilvigrisea]|uniref:Endonuclease/exonuclease/phosphatase domain-containing protein n=1 Tax=Mangrovactinospora gilvigrisea TaxID=1428644 RepID=A0A1J7BCM2_9ACTN|nr:endonuclease/exonuclease/phosphatase family protein [Mangrovactinospora gilvigrisea]OIV36427.1 hypothetical protein BIV57_16315 [Mangrovactinospora gilvigrisea]